MPQTPAVRKRRFVVSFHVDENELSFLNRQVAASSLNREESLSCLIGLPKQFLPMKSTVEIPAAKNAIHRIHYPCKRNAIRVNSQNIIFKKAILPLLYRQILRKYKHCFHKSVHIVHRCTAIRLQKWLSANFVEKCFRPRPVQMVCGSGTARRISLIQPNAP